MVEVAVTMLFVVVTVVTVIDDMLETVYGMSIAVTSAVTPIVTRVTVVSP